VSDSPLPPSALRLIIAGLGFWGASWLSVVRASPHWQLVALVDTDPTACARAATAAELDRSRCFSSITAAAQVVESDAVLVAAPPAAHAALAVETLENDLHCLLEKPFATSIAEAQHVVRRASETRRTVMVSQQYRYRPGARTVARLIDSGTLGRLGAASVTFANELEVHGFQHAMEEPLLLDMAIHHFDLIRGILGVEPVRLQAVGWNPSWSPFRGNASATVVLESGDGVAITYTGSLAPRGVRTGWDGRWDIACEGGTIHWTADDVVMKTVARPPIAKIQRRLFRRDWKGRRVKPVRIEEPDRLGTLAEFGAAIRENRMPETSGDDNIRSLALAIAAADSARRRVAVDLADVL
jgi:predicted dehydrogenase